MKITEHLKNAKSTLFSFEILPPLKGQSLKELLEGIAPLMDFKPPFVDVTYHREEFIYKICWSTLISIHGINSNILHLNFSFN